MKRSIQSYKFRPSLLLISVIFLNACSSPELEEQTEDQPSNVIELTEDQVLQSNIQTGNLEKKNISKILKVNGKVDVPPQNLISISIAMGGYLRSTPLLPGMQVKKGEVLATLEDEQYVQLQQDYLMAKAQFSFLESELKRQKELNENKASSDKNYQQTKSNYDSQYVLIKALEQKLKLIGIQPERLNANNISRSIQLISPVSGFVASVQTNIGKYVNPNDVIFELIDPKDIHLILTVYEKDIHELQVGQRVVAYANSNPGVKYDCEIIQISRSIGSRESAEVHCHFVKDNHRLLPGTFMNAEIYCQNSTVEAIPEESVVSFENENFVFVEQGKNKYLMKAIELGNIQDGYVHVLNAQNLNQEKIVIQGAYKLLMTLKNRE